MSLKILFIGSVNFSASALNRLIDLGINIDGIVTKKDSSFNADFCDLSIIAKKNNIPYKYVKDINAHDNIEWIKSFNPDIIFCLGFSSIIGKDILDIPSIGIIGFHPSELPKNRGRHPIIWSLVLGLTKTASTFFFMDKGVDSGDIISQKSIDISENDNANTLYIKITDVALKQIEEITNRLLLKTDIIKDKQVGKTNYWRKRSLRDGKIDWRMTAKSIHNLVRGLSKPYAGAHFEFNDEIIKVWETKIEKNDCRNIEPGKVIALENNHLIIKAGEDSIRLIEIDPIKSIKIGSYL